MNVKSAIKELQLKMRSHKSKYSATSKLIFIVSLVVIVFLVTIYLIVLVSSDMAKYSTLINNTGKIRGGAQRLIKLEIANMRNDYVISSIDSLIQNAKEIEQSRFFKFNEFKEFSTLIKVLNDKWEILKNDIIQYRNGHISSDIIIKESENFWGVSDDLVATIEKTSHYNVILYYIFSVISAFGVVSLLITLFVTKIYIGDKIEYLADHDQLTGLYNRHYFYKFFEREFVISSRNDRAFALLMCDIDYFKSINDNFGHDVGDLVLKEVANTIQKNSRESDLVARFGGEEFIILTIDGSYDSYFIHAERMRNSIQELLIKQNKQITISIGISVYNKGMKMPELIKKADEALYKAKRNGRNQVVIL